MHSMVVLQKKYVKRNEIKKRKKMLKKELKKKKWKKKLKKRNWKRRISKFENLEIWKFENWKQRLKNWRIEEGELKKEIVKNMCPKSSFAGGTKEHGSQVLLRRGNKSMCLIYIGQNAFTLQPINLWSFDPNACLTVTQSYLSAAPTPPPSSIAWRRKQY